MKSALTSISVIILLIIFCASSCKKNRVCLNGTAKGRIIGYDPCLNFVTYNKVAGAGFVIELDRGTSKDTTVTYGIPEGAFNFQSSYIDGSYSSYLFRPEIQDLFKIKFNYRLANDSEKTHVICNGSINIADFTAAVRGREIFISCISNQ